MNRKLVFLMALLLLSVSAAFALPTLAAGPLHKIAVLPFDDGSISDRWWGRNWNVGKGVSDELVTALVESQRFRVIERDQIDRILEEQRFGASGLVDSGTAAKLGQILGVQYLVMGKVTNFSFKTQGGGFANTQGFGLAIKTTTALVTIDARLVDTSSAEIVAAITGKGEKKETSMGVMANWNAMAFGSGEFRKTSLGAALRDAVNQVADGLAEKAYGNGPAVPASISGLVAYVSDNKVIVNLGVNDGVQPGMNFIIHHVIEVVRDPKTGEIIDEVTEPVAEIAVAEVKEKSSTCVVVNRLSLRYPISINDTVKQK